MVRSPKKKTAKPAVPYNIPPVLEQRLGPVEYRDIDTVVPYARALRKHPERQIVQLTGSMLRFGFSMPLLVDANGVLICGEARLEAAKRLGLTQVPVLVATFWSAAQVKAYRLADNQLATAASWNEELLRIELAEIIDIAEVPVEVLGWSTGEIDVILDQPAANDDEEAALVPEPPVDPVSRTGDLWLMDKHRLLCGSSLEAAAWDQLMAGQIAAFSLNDSPWNVKVNGHVSGSGRHAEFAMASGEMTREEFQAFNAGYLRNIMGHLKDGGIVMAFMDHAHLAELMAAGREVGLHHHNLCVWVKTNGGMGSLWRSQHELVLVLKHGTAPHTNAVELGKHGRYRTNVWHAAGANSFGATRDQDLADHPTVKPTGLLADAIRDVTHPGEIVVDAFSGSGSTILACERTKRVGYAIEIAPGYVDVGVRRWEAATGRQAVLAETGETFAEVAVRRRAEAQKG
jgi:DNA modification methylase